MKVMVTVVMAALVAVGTAAQDAEKPEGWQSSVAVGAVVNSGNSENMTVNGALAGSVETDANELRLGVEANYGEAEVEQGDGTVIDETNTQNGRAYVNYKQKLDRLYAYSDNSVFHDEIADIDSRLILGLGGGVYVVETENTKIGLEAGASWIREDLADDDDSFWAARFAGRLDEVLSETAKLWAAVEYLPETDDFDNYLLNAEAGLEAALNSHLSLRLVVQDRYDSVPPAGKEDNDVSVVSQLVYTL